MIARNPRGRSRSTKGKIRFQTRLALEPLEGRLLMDVSGVLGQLPQLLITTKAGDFQTVQVGPTTSVSDALAAYQANPNVQSVEVDQQVFVTVVPSDSRVSSLYAMNNTGQTGGTVDADIDAAEAWGITTGSLGTTVAIIDSGIDYTHPDLYLNVWINQGELPTGLNLVDTDQDGRITFWDLNASANTGKVADANGNGRIDGPDLLRDSRWANGVDNDGNGKRDDLIGWDFVNNDNDPYDDNSHGTHVAGTIGAVGNNSTGVVGVNWKVQLVGLKFLDAQGSGYTSNAVAALNYAVQKGVKISNNSWGGGGYSSTLATAISNARVAGHVFVAAAGNESANNDVTANYPSNYNYDNVIAVASTDHNDRLSSFSNYGAATVDLAAPGSSILSTIPGGGYASYNGTSMATPHVAGAAALVWSLTPTLGYSQVISRLLTNVDVIASLAGKVATGGRLNVFRALGSTSADTSGPRITAAVANSATSVSSMRVTFSEAINPASFTTADITSFTGPKGTLKATGVQAVAGSGNTQFNITFVPQTAVGAYRFSIGPDVRDAAGNRMDQNGNGVLGESSDAYQAAFSIAAPAVTFTNTKKVAIRDFRTTVSTITIGQNMTIADLNVRLNISHTYDSDLRITLRSPTGKTVTLVAYRGASGDNFVNTTLDDEASTSIALGRAPFSGSFRAEQALSAFDGLNVRGTWTLSVYDGSSYDIGMLNSWSLVVNSATSAQVRGLATGSQLAKATDTALAILTAPPPPTADKLPPEFFGALAWPQPTSSSAYRPTSTKASLFPADALLSDPTLLALLYDR